MDQRSPGRIAPIIGTVVFLFVAPGVMGVLIPWLITGWQMSEPLLGFVPFRWLGDALILLGVGLLLDSFARFALQGRGTPAPIYPTASLVISGGYRFVRNPMYVAVTALVVGQALLLGSAALLGYGLAFLAITHAFVVSYEEPTLRRTYGPEYDLYAAKVGRWIPRLTPWRGEAQAPLPRS